MSDAPARAPLSLAAERVGDLGRRAGRWLAASRPRQAAALILLCLALYLPGIAALPVPHYHRIYHSCGCGAAASHWRDGDGEAGSNTARLRVGAGFCEQKDSTRTLSQTESNSTE